MRIFLAGLGGFVGATFLLALVDVFVTPIPSVLGGVVGVLCFAWAATAASKRAARRTVTR